MKEREISFRGKRSDNGEWIEGFYWKDIWGDGDSCYIHYDTEDYCVEPHTVGQYTGLKDKSGKRIFEGDILRGFRYRDHGQWGENEVCIYTVKWDDKKSGFSPIYYFDGYILSIEALEVIGNIHDNPELLKEVQP